MNENLKELPNIIDNRLDNFNDYVLYTRNRIPLAFRKCFEDPKKQKEFCEFLNQCLLPKNEQELPT